MTPPQRTEAFARRGWRQWGQDGAARLGAKGCSPSAIVYPAINGWRGCVELGHRHLRDHEPTMLTAIARLEWAEAGGFFSPLWRNAPPMPIRSGWSHGVSNGLDFWEMALQKPRWLLRVELLRASTYVRIASTLDSATCRHYCSSYDVYAARDDLTWMIQHAMDAVERAAQENATRYGIPVIPYPTRMREPARKVVATLDELADV